MLDSAWLNWLKSVLTSSVLTSSVLTSSGEQECGGSKDSDEKLRQYIVNARFSILCG